jgi:hypothetical protein
VLERRRNQLTGSPAERKIGDHKDKPLAISTGSEMEGAPGRAKGAVNNLSRYRIRNVEQADRWYV